MEHGEDFTFNRVPYENKFLKKEKCYDGSFIFCKRCRGTDVTPHDPVSRLPAQNVPGVPKQLRHRGPLQLHRKAERKQVSRRTETRGHHVSHHLSAHSGGERRGPGGHLEKQKIPHAHVLLAGQPDAVGLASRLHLHGKHSDVGGEHSQDDSGPVVSQRRWRFHNPLGFCHQPPRHRHRAPRDDGANEALPRRQARPDVRPDRGELGPVRAPGRPSRHGLELHREPGDVFHRVAALRQELHPLLHHRVHPGAAGHRGALRAHLPHREVQHPAAGQRAAAQRSGEEIPEVLGSAEDGHHRSRRVHRVLAASLRAPYAGLQLSGSKLRGAVQGGLLLGYRHDQLSSKPHHLYPNQQRHEKGHIETGVQLLSADQRWTGEEVRHAFPGL